MDRHRSSRVKVVRVAVALVALAGCGNEDLSYTPGGPPGVEGPGVVAFGAGWATEREGELWVLTYGSSSNPQVASSAAVDGQTVTVTLVEAQPGGPMTADLAPTTSYVDVPDSVDRDSAVTVVLDGIGTVEVPDRETPGWAPYDS